MEALRSPEERIEKYSAWLAHYQLLLLPGAGGDATSRIEVSGGGYRGWSWGID